MESKINFLIIENDQKNYKCTAMLKNYSLLCRTIAIGQSITSQIFEMTIPKIGKSSWTLILFPTGQYDFERDDGQLSLYLKLINCEHEKEQILVDVKFFIDSEDKFSKKLLSNTFHYENNRTRWVGTKLVSRSYLHMQASSGYLIRENNLYIGCRIIHPNMINDDSQHIVSSDTQAKQKQTWTPKEIDRSSSVIDLYQPSEIYSKQSSIHSLPVINGSANCETTLHQPANINTVVERKKGKSGKKINRIFCW